MWTAFYVSGENGNQVTLSKTTTSERQAGKPTNIILEFVDAASKQNFLNNFRGANQPTGSSGALTVTIS